MRVLGAPPLFIVCHVMAFFCCTYRRESCNLFCAIPFFFSFVVIFCRWYVPFTLRISTTKQYIYPSCICIPASARFMTRLVFFCVTLLSGISGDVRIGRFGVELNGIVGMCFLRCDSNAESNIFTCDGYPRAKPMSRGENDYLYKKSEHTHWHPSRRRGIS